MQTFLSFTAAAVLSAAVVLVDAPAQNTGDIQKLDPHVGPPVADAPDVVVTGSSEALYQKRAGAESLQVTGGSTAGDKTETPHLTVATTSSRRAVAPGTRLSLFVDVAPKPRMHVYSPEQKDYISIALTLAPDEAFKAHDAVYPKAEKFLFEPLQETQLVYSKPFRIVQNVTIALTPAMRQRSGAPGATLTIKGMLRYQACDDKVCYLPKNLPLTWNLQLTSEG